MGLATIEITTVSAEETIALGRVFSAVVEPGDVVLLTGDLGAGKTQFSRGLGEGLGVCEAVTSPTFNIVLVHESGRIPLYHFDLYRLDDGDDLQDIDYYAIVEGDGVSLVEWGDKFGESVESADVEVRYEITGDEGRSIAIVALSERGSDIIDSLKRTDIQSHLTRERSLHVAKESVDV